ncbi:hypothetical protein BHM03_00061289 [Ensete ventricosum]|nr:hypothetical protein BHM03_00061289 [Ensete ventricosum]
MRKERAYGVGLSEISFLLVPLSAEKTIERRYCPLEAPQGYRWRERSVVAQSLLTPAVVSESRTAEAEAKAERCDTSVGVASTGSPDRTLLWMK